MLLSKLPQLRTSIFPVMSALAQQHNAINLAQGFPGFPVAAELIDLVSHYMLTGHNQYSPMAGILKLRQALSQKQYALRKTYYDPETEVTVTAGATEAVFSAISALVDKGDEVIVFEPVFDIYPPAIELAGGVIKRIKLPYPTYHYDWEQVRATVNSRTKLIILNSPHNPTGKTLSEKDIEELWAIVSGTNAYILSDEVYEHIVFDGNKHTSIAAHPGLKERTLVIGSLGKTFHCTGWRIGYCLAPAPLTTEFRKIHQFVTFSANTPVQYAMADYLQNSDHYLNLPDFFQTKRDFLAKQLAGSPFTLLPVEGSYFQLVHYGAISSKNEVDFAKWMTEQHRVATIPLSVFYADGEDNKVIRICFAKEENELLEAALRLKNSV